VSAFVSGKMELGVQLNAGSLEVVFFGGGGMLVFQGLRPLLCFHVAYWQ
jgi:hypothetical protein